MYTGERTVHLHIPEFSEIDIIDGPCVLETLMGPAAHIVLQLEVVGKSVIEIVCHVLHIHVIVTQKN